MNNLPQDNFEKLMKILPNMQDIQEAAKSKVNGFMDLNLDILFKQDGVFYIALSHYYRHQCGDMIADPDMELEVDFNRKIINPQSYQDAFIYHRIEDSSDIALIQTLNSFLCQWLSNLITQGHLLVKYDD